MSREKGNDRNRNTTCHTETCQKNLKTTVVYFKKKKIMNGVSSSFNTNRDHNVNGEVLSLPVIVILPPSPN